MQRTSGKSPNKASLMIKSSTTSTIILGKKDKTKTNRNCMKQKMTRHGPYQAGIKSSCTPSRKKRLSSTRRSTIRPHKKKEKWSFKSRDYIKTLPSPTAWEKEMPD